MLASVCIKYVHNYSFPSILNSARASYSRWHRLTEANTRLMRYSHICLTVSDIYSHIGRTGHSLHAGKAFRERGTGFLRLREGVFRHA